MQKTPTTTRNLPEPKCHLRHIRNIRGSIVSGLRSAKEGREKLLTRNIRASGFKRHGSNYFSLEIGLEQSLEGLELLHLISSALANCNGKASSDLSLAPWQHSNYHMPN